MLWDFLLVLIYLNHYHLLFFQKKDFLNKIQHSLMENENLLFNLIIT